MLIFGSSVSDWQEKAAYAQDKADNEYAKIHEVRCEGIEDVDMALAFMAGCAADTKCKDFLYHATINLNPGERLTKEQWIKAVDTLEVNLKLTGHHRVYFEHIKNDRQHYHIYWSRLPPDGNGPAVNMGNNYYIHDNTAKALEKEFGLKLAPRRDWGKASKKKESVNNRNSKTRIKPDIVTDDVTQIFKDSKTAKQFIRNLAKEGYTLTRGKNGSYVIVDKQGGYHGLMRRIKGAKLDDLRERFPDLDKMALPSLSDVLKSQRPASEQSFKKAARHFSKPRKAFSPRINVPFYTYQPSKSLAAILAQAKRHHPAPQKKYYPPPLMRKRKRRKDVNEPSRPIIDLQAIKNAEILAWAWEHGRLDILVQFGIYLSPDFFDL